MDATKSSPPDNPVDTTPARKRKRRARLRRWWLTTRRTLKRYASATGSESTDGLMGVGQTLRGWVGGVVALMDWISQPRSEMGLRGFSGEGVRSAVRTASVAAAIFMSYFALGLAMNEIEPFGIGNATKAHSARISARIMAPFYGSAAQDHIAVVLIDDSTLRARETGWPPRYTYYEEMLRRIMRQKPRAVYVDILLQDERAYDGSLAEARSALAEELAADRVPVWFGVATPGDVSLFSGLPWVGAAVSSWQGVGANYPLNLAPDNAVQWRGLDASAVPRNQPGAADTRSVAFLLYRAACRRQAPGCNEPADLVTEDMATVPMAVLWGERLPAAPTAGAPRGDCTRATGDEGTVMGRIWAAARGGWFNFRAGSDPVLLYRHREQCPYTLTLREQELDDPDVAALLTDRVVLVGTRLAGMDDSVLSPVHQRIPGVYLHAMALDNLMTWGQDRLHRDETIAKWSGWILALGVSLLLALILRYTRGRRRFFLLVGLGLLATVGMTAWLQVYHRQPPLDWLGGLALFGLIVFGVRRRPVRKVRT